MKKDIVKRKKLNKEVLQAAVFLCVGVLLFVYSLLNHKKAQIEWIMSPYLFPVLISIFLILLSISLYLEAAKKNKSENNEIKDVSEDIRVGKFLISLAAIFIYYIFMYYIGFMISGVLFLVFMFWFLGERRIWLIILLSLGVPIILYGLFHMLLHVMLP